jgi:GT2 family glycosyltransferase
MEASVVVPTFNRREVVARSLATLFAQDAPADSYEVIVVVDGSTDGTAEALRSLKPPCRFRIIEQENRGLAGARNSGWRAADSNLAIFLDDDMICVPGLVSAHIAAHRNQLRVVGFGKLLLSSDSPSTLATECFNREIGRFHLEHAKDSAVPWKQTDCVFGHASLSRNILLEFDGFDESFRMREDMELGIRLLQAGIQPMYIGNAVAYQYYAKTTADLLRDAEAFGVADLMMIRKHTHSPIHDQLRTLATERHWKRYLRRMAAAHPIAADFLLGPVCITAQVLSSVQSIRDIGVHALQMRRRIHWLHSILELDQNALERALD